MLMLSVQVDQYGAGVRQLGGAGERIVKVSAASTFGGDDASQNEFVAVWCFKATFVLVTAYLAAAPAEIDF